MSGSTSTSQTCALFGNVAPSTQIAAALPDLYRGKRVVLTPLPESDPAAVARVRAGDVAGVVVRRHAHEQPPRLQLRQGEGLEQHLAAIRMQRHVLEADLRAAHPGLDEQTHRASVASAPQRATASTWSRTKRSKFGLCVPKP